MTPPSVALAGALESATLDLAAPSPRLLLAADQAPAVRGRARERSGALDALSRAAQVAFDDPLLFGPAPEIPYLSRGALSHLAAAAFLLEDARFAGRALEGVEILLRFPAEEWIARPHRPRRCDHAMLNAAADVALALDLCGPLWPTGARQGVAARLADLVLTRFLETWLSQDAHWARPDYHWNWKIMCCGEAGLVALACRGETPDLPALLRAALAGVLDVLDFVPAEGDWPEGPGYWLATLGLGLRFGLALRHATGDAVDLFAHPALAATGDYLVHVTEPDGKVYDFNDNAPSLGRLLDYLLLLAAVKRRGDWVRTARQADQVTLEQLLWDDPALRSREPPAADTARLFPQTGVATMRCGWDGEATFVGFKCGRSAVGHSHLDANSFVLSAAGERLLVDEGIWPYAHFQGFFDPEARFNFDGNGTIGHNALLVDGRGQEFGESFPGRIVDFQVNGDLALVTGDAAATYGGRLDRFLRTLAVLPCGAVLVYDQVAAGQPRFLEWLFHHRGEASGDEDLTRLRTGRACLAIRRLLPREAPCWRTSDVVRSSRYTNSNTGTAECRQVRYRSFGPFHPQRQIDVLWALQVGVEADRIGLEVLEEPDVVRVEVHLPAGAGLEVRLPRAR
ncbi:MAG: heparinase II/III family protein [Gemmatimonadota bacterium]